MLTMRSYPTHLPQFQNLQECAFKINGRVEELNTLWEATSKMIKFLSQESCATIASGT